jgi:hypothetical protein
MYIEIRHKVVKIIPNIENETYELIFKIIKIGENEYMILYILIMKGKDKLSVFTPILLKNIKPEKG